MGEWVNHYIRQGFTPEQVSGFLAREHNVKISHETIYKHIRSDQRKGGPLQKHLRHSKRKYKGHYGIKESRGRIDGLVSSGLRPAVVDAKTRISDSELDTTTRKNNNRIVSQNIALDNLTLG